MRVGCVVIGVVLISLVAGGVAVWSHQTRLHPVKFARDTLTGYQSGHPRHQVSITQRVRWDPIGDHNAAVVAMDPDERAYLLLTDAAARLQSLHDESWGNDASARLPGFITARAGDPEWDRLTAWLEQEPVREAAAILREAAGRPALGAPLLVRDDPERIAIMARHGIMLPADTTPPPANALAIGILLPSLGTIRDLGRLSDAQARVAADASDAPAFVAAVEDIFVLAALAAEPPLLINQLIRIALLSMGAERIGSAVVHHPGLIDDATAARLDALLADVLAAGWTDLDPTMELVMFEDTMRRLMDNNGVYHPVNGLRAIDAIDQPDVYDAPPPSTAPLTAFNPDLLASYHEYERYIRAAEASNRVPWSPYTIPQDEIDAWPKRRDSIPGKIGRLLLGVSTMDWSRTASVFRSTHQRVLGLRVALAAHRHHLRHAEPPASLDAIDADLLAFEPVDGFTGGRLIYRWTGEGHLVYALGADGVDDEGRHAVGPDGEPVGLISDEYLREQWDGDWVVFPPRE